jgi:hypothetical protein
LERKRLRIAKAILSKKRYHKKRYWRYHKPDRAIAIKTAWYWHKNRYGAH